MTVTAPLPVGAGPQNAEQAVYWERILSKIEYEPVRGCWLWRGATNSAGYPCFKYRRRTVLVTRWILSVTARPFHLKELACHECDVHLCVAPEHLHHGTHTRNLKDAWARRRRTKPSTFLVEPTGNGSGKSAPSKARVSQTVRRRLDKLESGT